MSGGNLRIRSRLKRRSVSLSPKLRITLNSNAPRYYSQVLPRSAPFAKRRGHREPVSIHVLSLKRLAHQNLDALSAAQWAWLHKLEDAFIVARVNRSHDAVLRLVKYLLRYGLRHPQRCRAWTYPWWRWVQALQFELETQRVNRRKPELAMPRPGGQSVSPVSGASTAVRDGHDQDRVIVKPVDYGEGEGPKKQPPCPMNVLQKRLRSQFNLSYRIVKLIDESAGCSWIPFGVVPRGGLSFGLRGRVNVKCSGHDRRRRGSFAALPPRGLGEPLPSPLRRVACEFLPTKALPRPGPPLRRESL
jgi:hypothetical protein